MVETNKATLFKFRENLEMSSILHYIWSKGALPESGLKTTAGKELYIRVPGNCSTCEPNIFKEAVIEIDGVLFGGSVILLDETELQKSFQTCGTEETTVLIVSLSSSPKATEHCYNKTAQLHITCTQEFIQECHATISQEEKFLCNSTIVELPNKHLSSVLSELLVERLEDKQEVIERIFQQCDQRWDDTLLKIAIRSFGFGIQSDIFEAWANLLNTQALGKHSDNQLQVEAIFFGQAGLLDDESIPYYYRNDAIKNVYYNELKREFHFLQNKFNLKKLDYRAWGNSTPHVRIARLATLYLLKRFTVSGITTASTLTDMYKLLNHSLSGYWQNHTCFGGTETCGNGCMRQKQVDIIIINSIVPMLYVYGKHRRDEKMCKRGIELLREIDSEENNIIKRWKEQGMQPKCAADSQALLHLHRSYCKTNNCMNCRFALHYIRRKLTIK